jgi:hypothetical protein
VPLGLPDGRITFFAFRQRATFHTAWTQKRHSGFGRLRAAKPLIALGRRHLKLNPSAEESPTRSARRRLDVHGELKVLLVWLST